MTLELFANELLLDLFEYLPVVDLFRAFVGLNTRFNTLLFNQFLQHRLDFRSVSKRDFDIVCQRYLPLIIDRTISLCLSNDDETPDQINCFLSYRWTLRQFTNLQSLSLYHLHSGVLMCKLMVECKHLHNLIYLNINKCEFRQNTKEICQFLNNIWSLPKLTHCYLDISFNERRVDYFIDPSIISTSLQHLTIKSMSHRLTHLAHIFQCTPSLLYLRIYESDYSYDTPLSIPIPSIITLKLKVFDSLRVLTNFLENMPNLRHLTVETEDINMNGHQWEHIITNHLPKLQVFQLQMKFFLRNNEDKKKRVNKLLKSFQTRFWLEEHQWFVRCDWDRCQEDHCSNQIYLYTLPCTFNSYYFHDSIIKTKSTCPDNNIYPSYNQVHILDYGIAPSENRVLPQFTFSNIHDLILSLPVDDNFWSIMPQFDHLKSLKMIPHDTDQYDFDSQFQLQTILDRAPRLYSLGFDAWSSTSMGISDGPKLIRI